MSVPAGREAEHRAFVDLPGLLRPGDLLVLNDTRVIPARISFPLGDRRAEILLLHPVEPDTWECLARPGRRLRTGARVSLPAGITAEVLKERGDGGRLVRFGPAGRLSEVLDRIGSTPLPPYIREPLADPGRYQTVYARTPGSAAAPTAGLHFTDELLAGIRTVGVEVAELTLRIGLDTFAPMRVDQLDDHRMHSEWYSIPALTAAAVERCRARGGRVVAAGTTTARALESAAAGMGLEGLTDIFIRPGHRWRSVDLLLTNFHLPRSTLLVMVAAFAGRERVLSAYAAAVAADYRFYSFGDAMLLERFG